MDSNSRLDRLIERLRDLDNDLEQILLLANDVGNMEVNIRKFL